MKSVKYLVMVGLVLTIAVSTAQADGTGNGFYAGAAVVGSGFVLDSGDNTDKLDGDSKVSGGVYAGYKHRIIKGMFAAGEVFYHDTAADKKFSDGDKMELDPQYGLKFHLGYEWDSWSVYGILGAAHLGYDVTQNGEHKDDGSFQALFGGGAGYQFNEKISTNLEITTTGEEVDIAGDDDRTLGLLTMRLGVSYHF
ncbi:outer membrane beta-barrel protein [Pelobacter seleniigenes]|uniref:outer membrane beta-barrel protein n=1 Tax=Pelobacter seleniigenes TaxID=407188 RepID=UPI0004A74358|nr:outer membrane beta-barrel protein [Pelobacter seleniigenes]